MTLNILKFAQYNYLEYFHTPKRNPILIINHSHPSSFPKPLETTNLLSVSMILSILDISHKWNPTIGGLLYLAPLT